MKREYLTHNGDRKQYAKLMEIYKHKLENWKEKYMAELAENADSRLDVGMLFEKPIPPSQVEVTPDGYELHVYGLYNTYPIDKVATKKELLGWLRCISGKKWFNGRLCEDFINAVADQNKWELPFLYD